MNKKQVKLFCKLFFLLFIFVIIYYLINIYLSRYSKENLENITYLEIMHRLISTPEKKKPKDQL
jgi:hypothetical protein